jgi:hypothetical protein
MARYGTKAKRKIAKVMREWKSGKLRSGRSGRRVKSQKQAVAIGISEARRAGAKVPARKRRANSSRRGVAGRSRRSSTSSRGSRRA